MKSSVSDSFIAMLPQISKEEVKNKIEEEFEAIRRDGKIYTLSAQEINLLQAFRTWKLDAAKVVYGVFHWKVY